jgi:hypothetical protein
MKLLFPKTVSGIFFIFSYSLLSITFYSCQEPKSKPQKAIVIHARGISYPDMIRYLDKAPEEDYFKKMEAEGNFYKLEPINNAVTITNIASFETGSLPSEHGILGHVYAKREADTIRPVSGFAQRFEKESFWETADLQGKKVLSVGALTLHGKYEDHTNVDLIAQGSPTAGTQIIHLIQGEANGPLTPYRDPDNNDHFLLPQDVSDSVYIYQVDPRELILDNDHKPDNGWITKLKQGDWTELIMPAEGSLTEAYRIVWLPSADDTVKIYVRGTFKHRGYPEDFVQAIDREVGPSKGWPNIPLYAARQTSESILMDEVITEIDFIMDAFKFASAKKEYDLIMIDYPTMDRLGHAFLNQRASSSSISKHYEYAYQRMSSDFKSIEKFAGENGYELIITSGHGFSPIHTSFDLNRFLENNDIDTPLDDPSWEVMGIPGKVSAHVYLNEKLQNKDSLILQIRQELGQLEAPKTGAPLIEKVYTKDELNQIGQDHPDAGDLFVLLRPGYVFGTHGEERLFESPTFLGDHGYSPAHDESSGIYISNIPCSSCKITEIAGLINEILELN